MSSSLPTPTSQHTQDELKLPTYIYKLIPHTSPPPLPPTPLPTALPISPLDQSSGFIHLSTAPQVLGTLVHFFTSDPRVYVLRIPFARVQTNIKWEDPKGEVCGDRPGEGRFPHLYNGLKLGNDEVDEVVVWEREEEEEEEKNGRKGWEEVVKKAEEDGWLVY
ncbi:hypothetical protein BDY19DRAFT_715394 [Irpex rosettiformis]|uniref:Uncharacterized protein n=1 Tax=Irpex rosettiformis TaxID=378272 RepID=A0ACB8U8U9_9APHY|nr:hypothetical protein BDY19DRAFT_715394 [Irpex rosettiformis]